MREDLTTKNKEEAQKLGIDMDDIIERANYRLWSENAWKQKIILTVLLATLLKRLCIDQNKINDEASFRLGAIIYGFYEGSRQAMEQVKIKAE